jgi:hypothetical protein
MRNVVALLLVVGGFATGCAGGSQPDCSSASASPELVGTGVGSGDDWMLDHGTDFYWARFAVPQSPGDPPTYQLMSVTSAGTSMVASGDRRMALLQFTDALYWLEYQEGGLLKHRIRRLGPAGAETVIEGPQELSSYAVSRDYAYFRDVRPNDQTFQSRINRQPLAGGPQEVLDEHLTGTQGYAADDQSGFAQTASYPGDLLRISPTREITALLSGVYASVQVLRVDDAWLYYVEEMQSKFTKDTLVRRVPKTGGAVETLATNDTISRLALDATHVYFWSTEAINRVDKTSGKVSCVARTSAGPGAFTVGDTHLYWSDGQSIWRVPKPAP